MNDELHPAASSMCRGSELGKHYSTLQKAAYPNSECGFCGDNLGNKGSTFEFMISEAQLEKLFPGEGKARYTYLLNKHQGGTNNSKGNTFENQFAVYKIAEHFNEGAVHDHTFFTGQEVAFIDDLVIEMTDRNRLEYYQIKDVQALSWTGSAHPIEEDFEMQHQICRDFGKTATLELVVSNEMVWETLDGSMGKALKTIASVRHFAKGTSIQNLLYINSTVRVELEKMCALKKPSTDKLVTLGTIVLGAWSASNQKRVSLQQLMAECHSANPNYIKGFEGQLPAKLAAILNEIAGFSYEVQGGLIDWTYGKTDKGTVSYPLGTQAFLEWEDEVIAANPPDFETLETYLSK